MQVCVLALAWFNTTKWHQRFPSAGSEDNPKSQETKTPQEDGEPDAQQTAESSDPRSS